MKMAKVPLSGARGPFGLPHAADCRHQRGGKHLTEEKNRTMDR
jgi:uncharacterized protein YqjF (DUF2071 family)